MIIRMHIYYIHHLNMLSVILSAYTLQIYPHLRRLHKKCKHDINIFQRKKQRKIIVEQQEQAQPQAQVQPQAESQSQSQPQPQSEPEPEPKFLHMRDIIMWVLHVGKQKQHDLHFPCVKL